MFTFHTQQQCLCQLVSMRMKEKHLAESLVLLPTEIKKLAHFFSFKSIPLIELVQRRSVLFLF